MIPGKYNIEIWRGGTWYITTYRADTDFSIYDEIRMQIRPPFVKGIPKKDPLLELTLDNGRVLLEQEGAVLRFTITAADTTDLCFDEGVYDIELVQHVDLTADPPIPDEIVDKYLYGSVEVYGEKTV